MGTRHPISGRKARQAVGAALGKTIQHEQALRALAYRIDELDDYFGSFLTMGLLARIAWAVTGRVVAPGVLGRLVKRIGKLARPRVAGSTVTVSTRPGPTVVMVKDAK